MNVRLSNIVNQRVVIENRPDQHIAVTTTGNISMRLDDAVEMATKILQIRQQLDNDERDEKHRQRVLSDFHNMLTGRDE